jgi:hypothetical protein
MYSKLYVRAKLQAKAEKPVDTTEKLEIFRIGGFAFRRMADNWLTLMKEMNCTI